MVPSKAILGMMAALVLFAVGGCGKHGPKTSHGTVDVHFTDGVTKAEADTVGDYLRRTWGEAPFRRTVQLKKKDDGYVFRMVVKKEFLTDEATLNKLAFDAARISRDALGSAPVELHACDANLETVKVIPPRPDVRYSVVDRKVEVFYPAKTDKDDAEKLAKYLTAIMGNEAIVSFKLARRDKVNEVHMVTNPEALKQPEIIEALKKDRKAIADNAFKGQPTELHLCDDVFNTVLVLKE